MPEVITPIAPTVPASIDSKVVQPTDIANKSSDPPARATEPKLFKVKVDGVEREVTEDELVRDYQLKSISEKRLNETAAQRKQVEEIVTMLKDPKQVRKVLKELGHDTRKLSEDELGELLLWETYTPEQKEAYQNKQKIQELEQQQQERQQQEEQNHARQARDYYANQYQTQIIEALKISDLPQTPETVSRIAQKMAIGLKYGMELSPTEVIPEVKRDYMNELKAIYGKLEGEHLYQFLGDDTVKKVQQASLAKMKNPNGTKPAQQAKSVSEDKPLTKKITKDEWKAKLERIKRGLE